MGAQIKTEEFDYKLGEKTTCVLLKLRNGFEVVGTSGCVDPANYNHEIGKKYARERAGLGWQEGHNWRVTMICPEAEK